MKSIYLLVLGAVISIGSFAQKSEDHNQDKRNHTQAESDHMRQHEKVIWAGTGMDVNNKTNDEKNVPHAVVGSFHHYAPNQSIDNVRKYRGSYAVTFNENANAKTHIYKSNGTFVEARTAGTDAIIPSAVREKLRKSNKQYSTDDVVLIEKANKQRLYRIHMKENHKDRYVIYDEKGHEVHHDY